MYLIKFFILTSLLNWKICIAENFQTFDNSPINSIQFQFFVSKKPIHIYSKIPNALLIWSLLFKTLLLYIQSVNISVPIQATAQLSHLKLLASSVFLQIVKVFTRRALSTNTIWVLNNLHKFSNRVAKTIGTQVPGPFTRRSCGFSVKITRYL